jgi:hypothetical protein
MNVIKHVNSLICKPLCFIINHSLSRGEFPNDLKHSIITPVHKGGTNEVTNFRPISLLSNFSKIFESIVKNRIVEHFENNHLFNENQHGFREKHSTTTLLTELTNEIANSLDKNLNTTGLLCDLSKAFDCVQHNILLKKLHHYGIRGKALDWFKSYLQDRKQKTIVNKIESKWEKIKIGVPQGSVLGPILFIIYTNDLFVNINNKLVIYADDTTAIIKHRNLKELAKNCEETANNLNNWFKTNGLSMNFKKTSLIQFKTSKNSNKLKPEYINDGIQVVENSKLLGLMFDSNLNWKNHIENLTKKLNQACFNMSCLTSIVNMETKLMLYYSYFQSLLVYGILMWGNSTNWLSVFKVQKKIIRIMTNAGSRDSCKSKFQKLNILTFPSLYIFELLKYIKRNKKIETSNLFKHCYDTRKRENLLMIPVHKLKIYEKSPLYMAIKVLNKIGSSTVYGNKNEEQFLKQWKVILQKKAYYNIEDFFSDPSFI